MMFWNQERRNLSQPETHDHQLDSCDVKHMKPEACFLLPAVLGAVLQNRGGEARQTHGELEPE